MAFAGYAQVAWYVAITLGVVGFAIAGWPQYSQILPKARRDGSKREFTTTLALAALSAAGVCAAAFVVGAVIAWGNSV